MMKQGCVIRRYKGKKKDLKKSFLIIAENVRVMNI